MSDIRKALTERELQTLRNMGNEAEAAADEIEALRAALAQPQAAQPADTLELDLLRTDFKRECDDTDSILRMLGLDPQNCRTDGGSLKCTIILDAIEARDRMIRHLATMRATPPTEPAPQAEPAAVGELPPLLNFDQLQSVMAAHFGGRELTDDEADSAESFARAVERAVRAALASAPKGQK